MLADAERFLISKPRYENCITIVLWQKKTDTISGRQASRVYFVEPFLAPHHPRQEGLSDHLKHTVSRYGRHCNILTEIDCGFPT